LEVLRGALNQKELLLQEIHHRVKNNMQVIISLISMQSRAIENEEIRAKFNETRSRVQAMSAVHEVLHQADNFSKVDLTKYLPKLADTVFRTYKTGSGSVQVETEIEPIEVPLDQSYPLGLVINELLSNSMKYAYPDGRSGTITITVNLADNKVFLVISDDGVGMPNDFNWDQADSLGLKLVKSLVEVQLRGELKFDSSDGTKWKISFPL
jgi:two-component sensor histidine kinase